MFLPENVNANMSGRLGISLLTHFQRWEVIWAGTTSVHHHEASTFHQMKINGNVLTCFALFLFISSKETPVKPHSSLPRVSP